MNLVTFLPTKFINGPYAFPQASFSYFLDGLFMEYGCKNKSYFLFTNASLHTCRPLFFRIPLQNFLPECHASKEKYIYTIYVLRKLRTSLLSTSSLPREMKIVPGLHFLVSVYYFQILEYPNFLNRLYSDIYKRRDFS